MNDKLLLLGLLKAQDMHGYQLYEFIEHNLSSCTNLTQPSAYFLLNRMEQEGLVIMEETRQGNRPPRKVYRITPKGEETFWLLLKENLSSYRLPVFTSDIGIAFLDYLNPEEACFLLLKRRQVMQEVLSHLRAVPSHTGSVAYLIQHQIYHLETEIHWLDWLIQEIHPKT